MVHKMLQTAFGVGVCTVSCTLPCTELSFRHQTAYAVGTHRAVCGGMVGEKVAAFDKIGGIIAGLDNFEISSDSSGVQRSSASIRKTHSPPACSMANVFALRNPHSNAV